MDGIRFKCRRCGATGITGYVGGSTGNGDYYTRRCFLCGVSVCNRASCALTRWTSTDNEVKVCLSCAEKQGWAKGLPQDLEAPAGQGLERPPDLLKPLLEQGAESSGAPSRIRYALPDLAPGLLSLPPPGASAAAVGEALAAHLGAPARDVRAFAAWALASASCESGSCLAALLPALRDADGEVRELAAWGLGNLAPRLDGDADASRLRAAARGLVTALGDPAPEVRGNAAYALTRFRVADEALAGELADAAERDGDETWQRDLNDVLRRMGPAARPLVGRLAAALTGDAAGRAVALLHAIGPDAAPAVSALLAHAARLGDGLYRSLTLKALGAIGARPDLVLPAVVEYRDDPYWGTRAGVWELVALAPPPRPAGVVAKLLDHARARLADPDEDVRAAGAGHLGSLGPDAAPAVGWLAPCLADRSPKVREGAVKALRSIGLAAADVLRPLLGSPDPVLQRWAAVGLARAGLEVGAALEVLTAPLRVRRSQGLGPALDALAELGATAAPALELLVRLFPGANALVKKRLGHAFVNIGRPAAPALAGLLRHESADVRRRAADCLGQLGSAAAGEAQALRQAAGDPDPAVRAAAERALAGRASSPDSLDGPG